MLIDQFRQGMRRLTGAVTVVTTRGVTGERRGVTATAICSLSVEPPSLIACLNRSSWVAQLAPASGVFAVNVLAEDQEEVARAFAGQSGLVAEERFRAGHWRSGLDGAPILDNCVTAFVCQLERSVDYASHVIMIGRVRETFLPPSPPPALLYVDGAYQRMALPVG